MSDVMTRMAHLYTAYFMTFVYVALVPFLLCMMFITPHRFFPLMTMLISKLFTVTRFCSCMARLGFSRFVETPCAVSGHSSIGWTGIVRRRGEGSVSVGPGCYRAALPILLPLLFGSGAWYTFTGMLHD